MAKIIIPLPLQAYTSQKRVFFASGNTIAQCLDDLIQQYQHLRPYIFAEHGHLSSYCNTYLNGQDIRHLPKKLETEVMENDKLEIIPSLVGG